MAANPLLPIYEEMRRRKLVTSQRCFSRDVLGRSPPYMTVVKNPSGDTWLVLYRWLLRAGQHDLAGQVMQRLAAYQD